MPTPASEIVLIEAFSDTQVIGMTINHEGMTDTEIGYTIAAQSEVLRLPVTDALNRPAAQLLGMVAAAYPGLRKDRHKSVT
jgi:uncharacterized NAD-dependent epimerase/dehydratase family protein